MLSLTFWIDLSFIATLNFQYIPCFCFPKAFEMTQFRFFFSLLIQVRYYLFRRVHVKTLFHWDKLNGRTIWDSQRNRSRKDWWRKGKRSTKKKRMNWNTTNLFVDFTFLLRRCLDFLHCSFHRSKILWIWMSNFELPKI